MIQNGNFEVYMNPTLAAGATLPKGDNRLGYWTINSDSIKVQSKTNFLGKDGNYCVEFLSSSSISQNFVGNVGKSYILSFYMAGNPTVGSTYSIKVTIDTISRTFTFNSQGKSKNSMGWERKSFYFTLTSPSALLTFTSLSTSNSYGPMIDLIQIDKMDIVANGGFELSDPLQYADSVLLQASSTVLSSWKINSGSIDLVRGYSDPTAINIGTWIPASGFSSVETSGGSNGTISQVIKTIPNLAYVLSFQLSGNPKAPGPYRLFVQAGDDSNTFQFSTSGKSESNMGWTLTSLTFVPIVSNPTILFQSLDNSAYGAAIDDVSVSVKSIFYLFITFFFSFVFSFLFFRFFFFLFSFSFLSLFFLFNNSFYSLIKDLLGNGDFEYMPEYNQGIYQDTTSISSWTVLSSTRVISAEYWQAYSGSFSIFLISNNAKGVISQTVSLNIGVSYILSFAVSVNAPSRILNLRVSIGDSSENLSISVTQAMTWDIKTLYFKAMAEQTTITFEGTDGDVPNGVGIALDHIVLQKNGLSLF